MGTKDRRNRTLASDRSFAIAEAEREAKPHTGFLAGLFSGEARFSELVPFPTEDPEDVSKAEATLAALRTFLHEHVDPDRIDRNGEIPQDVFERLRALGLFGVKIPVEYGGLGFSQSNYRRIATLLGSWDANLTALISAHNSIGVAQPLLQFGTDEQKAWWLPRIAAGAITGFALTEEDAGSDITRIRTYAKRLRDPETGELLGYRLTGRKLYTTNAAKSFTEPLAEFLVVIARIVDDVTELDDPTRKPVFGAFIVRISDPAVAIEHRCTFVGLRAISNGVTAFRGCVVPTFALIGREGDGIRIALSTLAIGRLTLPAACVGGLKQALSVSRWWAKERVQWFDRPLIAKELIAEKVVSIAANLLALEAIVSLTCRWVDAHRDVRLESAACKVLGSEWTWAAWDATLQIRSGRGFETALSLRRRGEVPVSAERPWRDCRVNRIFEGTNEVMRLWIVREGLEVYRRAQLRFLKGSFRDRLAVVGEMLRIIVRPKVSRIDRSVPRKLRRHLRFVAREARRLARFGILAAAIYREDLGERHQLVASRLADIAMELFAMSAVCAYASAPSEGRAGAIELADYFCNEARKRLRPLRGLTRQLFFDPNRGKANRLAEAIVSGSYAWLEDGALSIVDGFAGRG